MGRGYNSPVFFGLHECHAPTTLAFETARRGGSSADSLRSRWVEDRSFRARCVAKLAAVIPGHPDGAENDAVRRRRGQPA